MVKMVKTLTPIDDLTGGLEAGTLVLIYGPTGCGKTTLCLKIAENAVKMGEYQAIYIDTEGGAPELPGIRFMRVRDFRELVLRWPAKPAPGWGPAGRGPLAREVDGLVPGKMAGWAVGRRGKGPSHRA